MSNQRILFIKPSYYDTSGKVVTGRKAFFPSRTLPYLAALTPTGFQLRIQDDYLDPVQGTEEADVVVMTGLLPNIPRAMDIGKMFRKRNIPVIIGGIGIMSVGKEATACGSFSTVVNGEAEPIWANVIEDYAANRLQPYYEAGRAAELNDLPLPRYDLLNMQRYMRLPGERSPFLCVETARGCPHSCSFCAVSMFFGRDVRFRPVGDVVREMRELGARYYILTDDNLIVDPARALELFKAMKPLGLSWAGQFDVNAARHPDVLRAMGESGCAHAVVGIESLEYNNLASVNKLQNTRLPLEDVVAAFRNAGIAFTASLVLGLDYDTPETIQAMVEQLIRSGAEFILPWVLVPGPGSVVYEQFKSEHRLLHENYSLYNGVDVVFRPKGMTSEQLFKSQRNAMQQFYALRRSVPRAWKANRKLDVLGLSLYFWQAVRRGRHPFTGAG